MEDLTHDKCDTPDCCGECKDDHPIYKSYFNISGGLPKIHEHDNKPAQALALFEKEKMIGESCSQLA